MSNNYLYGSKDSNTDRLTILNQVYNQFSKAFFQKHLGNKNGSLLEVGCGRGLMLKWLSEQPFITKVMGIDIEANAINSSKALNIANAEFKILSAYDIDQLPELFDFIYQRFVLIHLTNPLAAIKAIYNRLKPGGFFICEACIHSHCFSDPVSKGFDQFIKSAMQMFASQGKDGDIGKHLVSHAADIGFVKLGAELHQPILNTATEKKLMLLGLQGARSLFLQENLLTSEELDHLQAEMQQDLNNAQSLWAAPTLCQFLLQKP